jgi:asparagine synthase (glutamine-hydrolysing)
VSEFARRDVKVILSGVGGDELFGGYRRYLGHRFARRFAVLPSALRRAVVAAASILPADRHTRLGNWSRLARGFASSIDLPADERYRGYLQVLPRNTVAALLAESAAGGEDALARAFAGAGDDDAMNRMCAVDLETQLPDDLLMLTDKMTMAASLECRVPLLDRELTELAATIPEECKVGGSRLKGLMKAALADLLPVDVLEREKRGFGTPMGAWLKRDLKPVMQSLLSPAVLKGRGLFVAEEVAQLVRGHETARIDGTDPLLALINLEIWSRLYIDRRSHGDVSDELAELLR